MEQTQRVRLVPTLLVGEALTVWMCHSIQGQGWQMEACHELGLRKEGKVRGTRILSESSIGACKLLKSA